MRALPPIPSWVALEQETAFILQQQEEHGWYFHERVYGSLHRLSRESLTKLINYYVTGILSSSDRNYPKRNNKTQGYIKAVHSQD